MPFNFLLLPLLGDYIFARQYYRSRYIAYRSENHRLMLLAAQYGFVFLAIAASVRAIMNLAQHFVPSLTVVNNIWRSAFPFDYSGTAVIAFLLGATSWKLLNYRLDSDKEVDKIIREKGDPMEMLLKETLRESRPVLLTAKSGKVYVGTITANFNPAHDVQSVMIMPMVLRYFGALSRCAVSAASGQLALESSIIRNFGGIPGVGTSN